MEMEGKIMGSANQLLESSTNVTDTPAGIVEANIVELPFRKARHQIAQTTSRCEVLRQGIDVLQRTIEKLEGIVAKIDDHETREKLRQQLSSMNELLLLRLAQLSSIDHMLQVTLRRTHRPRH
jgi:hypothetical protein